MYYINVRKKSKKDWNYSCDEEILLINFNVILSCVRKSFRFNPFRSSRVTTLLYNFFVTERFIVSIITAGLKFRIKFIFSIDEGVQQLPISALEISGIYKNAQNGLKMIFTKA